MTLKLKKLILLFFSILLFSFISNKQVFAETKNELVYKADSLLYNYEMDELILYKNAEIKYGNYILTADSLVFYQNKNEAKAYKNPHLKHNEEFIEGDSMKINIRKQEGLVYNAHAQNEDGGIFWGDVIKSKQGKIFYIKNSCYTTCDHDEPHYFFYSKRMKVLAGDKVVAAPVVLYIDEVPAFYLPFAFFSINKNPRSGFLMPEFGVNHNSSTGRYIRDLGYFWLINNYMTNTAYYSYEEKGRWELKDTFLYTDRLKTPRLRGNSSWQYEHYDYANGSFSNAWYLKGAHYQKFSSRSDLNIDYRYSSSQKILQNSEDLEDKLESQNISSNLIWNYKADYGNFQTQLYHYKDFETNSEKFYLPRVSFSTPIKTLYESKGFIKKINLSYSANAQNTLYKEESDSLTAYVKHRSSIDVSFPDIWYFRLNFSSHFVEQWFNKTKDLSEWSRVFYNYGNSISTSTNIYGYFYPSKALSFRHKITPQVSYIASCT